MSNARRFLIGIGAVVAFACVIVFRGRFRGTVTPPDLKVDLNEAQKRQIFEPGNDWVTLYRFKSHDVWQASTEPEDPSDATAIGRLYRKPQPPEVAVAFYLCDFGTPEQPNLVLDAQNDCSRHGKALKPDPVGYGSEKIRAGYRLIFRCRSKGHGTYLSYKSDCEGEGDRVETDLAAFRNVE